jgi:phage protein D
MTLRRKGTDVGTLKTRIGFLIRDQAASWHGAISGAIFNSIGARNHLTVTTRESG